MRRSGKLSTGQYMRTKQSGRAGRRDDENEKQNSGAYLDHRFNSATSEGVQAVVLTLTRSHRMTNVRKGEFHDGEVIEAANDSFIGCHFIDCQVIGIAPKFTDCTFANTHLYVRDLWAVDCIFCEELDAAEFQANTERN